MVISNPRLRAKYILQISDFRHDFLVIEITCRIIVLYKAAICGVLCMSHFCTSSLVLLQQFFNIRPFCVSLAALPY